MPLNLGFSCHHFLSAEKVGLFYHAQAGVLGDQPRPCELYPQVSTLFLETGASGSSTHPSGSTRPKSQD